MGKKKFILWFNQIGMRDVAVVGGKNASLGEMYRNLTKRGVRVPNGFATTTTAYWYFLKEAGIEKEIRKTISSIGTDKSKIDEMGPKIRNLILKSRLI